MKKGISTVLTLTIVLLMFISFVSSITGTMGNARMILYPKVSGNEVEVLEKTILVKNINNIPLNITLVVESSDQGKEFIQLIDSNFTLNPNEEKKARFKVDVKSPGEYQGKINVIFTPLNKEPGVVLSSTIVVIAEKSNGEIEKDTNSNKIIIFVVLTLVLLIILGILFYLMKKKGNKRGKLNGPEKNK